MERDSEHFLVLIRVYPKTLIKISFVSFLILGISPTLSWQCSPKKDFFLQKPGIYARKQFKFILTFKHASSTSGQELNGSSVTDIHTNTQRNCLGFFATVVYWWMIMTIIIIPSQPKTFLQDTVIITITKH